MPLTIERPNLVPSPFSASATADRVRFEPDRVDLLGDRGDGLEQGVELGGDRRAVDDVCTGDTGRAGVLRRGQRHVLVAEHRAGLDVGTHIGRDGGDVVRVDQQRHLRHRLAVPGRRVDLADPADHHAVEGDLRSRVHHQTGPPGDHGQGGCRGEVTAELQEHQREQPGDENQEHRSHRLERGTIVNAHLWSPDPRLGRPPFISPPSPNPKRMGAAIPPVRQ